MQGEEKPMDYFSDEVTDLRKIVMQKLFRLSPACKARIVKA